MTTLAIGSTAGLSSWIVNNILGLLILIVGIIVLFRAHKRNLPDVLTILAGVVIGLLVVGLATNGNGVSVGQWLAHLVFG